jgi:uncharacterized protein
LTQSVISMTKQRSATFKRKAALNVAFLSAARRGDFVAVTSALLDGASPSARDDTGNALAAMQKKYRRRKMMRLLVHAGVEPNQANATGQTPLMQAVIANDRTHVVALLDIGADPNVLNEQHETALSFAVVWGRAEIAALLLRRGARPDHPLRPWTPLMYAAHEGHVSVGRVLLAAGAKISRRDSYGRTAEDIARTANRKGFVKMLRAKHRVTAKGTRPPE